ncbi:hypothetical protein [Streptomyces sp. 3211]|uniref:hypothetical protein n=1 Tax=Streptomyces sp. 3211 TaxID=1964449 RepID=UPI0009A4AB75|nr:hypothetical protein [Streptomyces sp. 3211]
MNEPFAREIISTTAAPPGFSVDVWHYETPAGGQETATEKHRFPIIAWAVVKDDDWALKKPITEIEPVFLWNGRPVHTSQYRAMFSDVKPAPGKSKYTVGVRVNEPTAYVPL